MGARTSIAFGLLATFFASTSAFAQRGPAGAAPLGAAKTETSTPAVAGEVPSAAAEPPPKRAMPDYDGREPESTAAEDAALFVPKVVFFPLYLVSEFVLRRPIEWLVVSAEKYKWPALVLDFFTFGEERNAGVFPTALFDFGLRTSVGVYAFWDKFLAEQNGVRLYAAYGGPDWYTARLTDRVTFGEDKATNISFTVGATRRSDYLFYGVGPGTSLDTRIRYSYDRLESIAGFESLVGESGSINAFAGLKRVVFRYGTVFDDPALDDRVKDGLTPAPPGYNTPYTIYSHGVGVAFDTRKRRPAPGSGFRLELETSQEFDLEGTLRSPLIGYGGAIGGFLDMTKQHRVVSLFVSAKFIEPLDKRGTVPFTEMLSIGGTGPMTGFRDRALIGQSALAARLEYRWPIWVFLDGALHFAVGNVFGERAEDFDPKLLRMSFGLGMRTSGRPDHAFNFAFALGTDTFDQGAAISSVRLTVGATRGF